MEHGQAGGMFERMIGRRTAANTPAALTSPRSTASRPTGGPASPRHHQQPHHHQGNASPKRSGTAAFQRPAAFAFPSEPVDYNAAPYVDDETTERYASPRYKKRTDRHHGDPTYSPSSGGHHDDDDDVPPPLMAVTARCQGLSRRPTAGGRLQVRCRSATAAVSPFGPRATSAGPSLGRRRSSSAAVVAAARNVVCDAEEPCAVASPTVKKKKRAVDLVARSLKRSNERRQAARRECRRPSPFALKVPSDDDDDDDDGTASRRTRRSRRSLIDSSEELGSSTSDDFVGGESTSEDDGFDCPPMDVDAVQKSYERVRSTRPVRSAGKIRKRSVSAVVRRKRLGGPSPVIRPQRGEAIPGHFLLPLQAGFEDATEMLLMSLELCQPRR